MADVIRIREMVKYLRDEISNELQLQQFQLLLELACNRPEPISYNDLVSRLGISKASVSRNVKVLGTRYAKDSNGRFKQVGLELVKSEQDQYEPRQFVVSLTKKGSMVLKSAETILEGGGKKKR